MGGCCVEKQGGMGVPPPLHLAVPAPAYPSPLAPAHSKAVPGLSLLRYFPFLSHC